MGLKHNAGNDASSTGGNFLNQAGRYHMVVNAVTHPAYKSSGEAINNSYLGFELQVLAPESQRGKKFSLVLFRPKLSGKDGGKFSQKKIDRSLIAAGIMTKDQLGQQGIDLDLDKGAGSQVFIELEESDSSDSDQVFLEMSYANIFPAVANDSETADYPRDANVLPGGPDKPGPEPKSSSGGLDL